MNDTELTLLLHGAIVMLVGLLCGAPYGIAMRKGRPERIERAWRVAHSGLTMGGTLLIAVAAALAVVTLGEGVERVVAHALIASGYGFCVSLPYAAWGDHASTYWPGRSPSSWIIGIGNLVGSAGSLVAAIVLVYGVASLFG